MFDDALIIHGGAVKALGNGRIGGHLVLFGDATKTDLEGDYFTPKTDFDIESGAKTSVYYNHALDVTLGSRKLGKGEMKVDAVGVWLEAQLELRDAYEKAVYSMAQKGKLGWSSGTAPHLVEREQKGAAFEITRWPLGLDASLTPTPAEKRTHALPLKSWKEMLPTVEIKDYCPSLRMASGDATCANCAYYTAGVCTMFACPVSVAQTCDCWEMMGGDTAGGEMKTVRSAEKALRDAGFSQREAKAILSDGFKATQRDAEANNNLLRAAIEMQFAEAFLLTGV